MSRICVKNLPKYVAEDRLREFFSQKGEVTDAKLLRTKDGNSRQFGFVGFRTEGEAKEALKYFNNSYMDTFRITCEIARKIGDPNIPHPWSRHSAKMQEKLTENKNKVTAAKNSPADSKGDKKSSKKGSENNDPQLQEFLEIMQPRSKSKLWANDTLDASFVDQNDKAGGKHTQSNGEVRKESASVLEELDETDEREDVLPESHLVKQSHVGNHTVSDMDYFKSRVRKEWSDSENDNDKNDDNNSIDESPSDEDVQNLDLIESLDASRVSPPDKVKGPSEDSNGEMVDSDKLSSGLKDEKEVLETGRLFIRNLPYTATEDDLEELFSKFGNVSQVHLVVDKDTKRSKGIAYVLYSFPESAVRALEELDNSIFQGRLLHIMPAKQKNPSEKQDVSANQAPKTFKQQREEQRKASEASGDTRAWNSLFIRPDTVVEYLARKHGVSKSDLLDQEADNLAVRIAWGETTVIKETKEALKKAGVNIEALEELTTGKTDDVRRSNHVLLVKNLPYASSEGELAKMFGKFGSLDKIIIPPTKTLALVVFLEAAEARAAFKGLAYKRYKDAPLYLEWAPSNIISGNVIVGEKDVERVLLEQNVEGISEVDVDPDRVESRSLFVKNLNFRTSDEDLRKHFSENIEEGKIRSVRVKKHLKNRKNVSMGFGFIEFDSVETATNICRDLQGTVLDGHALILQLCHAKKDEQILKKIDKDKSMTKLLVRNVAFEATEKDLRQLFSPFGQIKSLRVPMKFGSHRGFAFVEYVTKQEAENALQALSSTHLYGRHLVLERAKEGESLEELRARTAAQFAEEQNNYHNPIKLSKKRKHLAVVDEGNIKFQRIAD